MFENSAVGARAPFGRGARGLRTSSTSKVDSRLSSRPVGEDAHAGHGHVQRRRHRVGPAGRKRHSRQGRRRRRRRRRRKRRKRRKREEDMLGENEETRNGACKRNGFQVRASWPLGRWAALASPNPSASFLFVFSSFSLVYSPSLKAWAVQLLQTMSLLARKMATMFRESERERPCGQRGKRHAKG